MIRLHKGAATGVATVVVGYALFAALWIALSDRAMGLLFRDPEALVLAGTAKGWLFVAVTSLLLYGLLRRFAAALLEAHRRELALERERTQPPPMLVAIANASTDAIFAKDAECRYLFVNHAAAQLIGRSAEELLGQDDRALFPPEQAQRFMSRDRQVRLSGQVETSDESLPTQDGQRVYQTTKGPLRGADGQVFGSYGIARDVTESRRAQEELQQLADDLGATLKAIPDLMFEVDADGRYLKVKALDEALLAAPSEQLLGRTIRDVLPPEAAATVTQAVAAASQTGTDFGRTITLPLAAGVRHFELSVARKPMVAGQGERFIVLSRDITARQSAQAELRQRNQELERFNRAATERELRMVALKCEVNAMARAAGRPEPYGNTFADLPEATAAP